MKEHNYTVKIKWTGNTGSGTSNYRSYERNHIISAENKPDLPATSDPAFRGDNSRYTPEELLVGSISSCHMLWFLHLCSEAGVIVEDYMDNPTGIMVETNAGGGYFQEVTLHPLVVVREENMVKKANELHPEANRLCFIANSCNFTINHSPETKSLS